MLRYTSSVGTAAGVDRVEAVLHGVCELVEHDALLQAMLSWFIAGFGTLPKWTRIRFRRRWT